MIDIEVDDYRATARFRSMPEKVRASLTRKITSLSLQLEAKAKANAPVGPNTSTHTGGQLRRSIHSSVESTALSITGKVATGADTPYARIQELGGKTAPHDIYPSKAKALHFFNGAGDEIFAKVVHHPGSNIKAQLYMHRAFEDMLPAIRSGIREAVVQGMVE